MKLGDKNLSMPVHAPLYPPPPYRYEAEVLQVMYRADPDRLKEIVPEPLIPSPAGIVSCWVARYPRVTGLGPYFESFFLIAVGYKERLGAYCPFMWVSSDAALAAGREIWGFPKKISRMSLKVINGVARGISRRADIKIIDASVRLSEEITFDVKKMTGETFLLKVIPSVNGKDPPEKRLVSLRMEEVEFTKLQGGPCTLSMERSPADPTYLLEPEEIMGGFHGFAKWVLPYGETVEIL